MAANANNNPVTTCQREPSRIGVDRIFEASHSITPPAATKTPLLNGFPDHHAHNATESADPASHDAAAARGMARYQIKTTITANITCHSLATPRHWFVIADAASRIASTFMTAPIEGMPSAVRRGERFFEQLITAAHGVDELRDGVE